MGADEDPVGASGGFAWPVIRICDPARWIMALPSSFDKLRAIAAERRRAECGACNSFGPCIKVRSLLEFTVESTGSDKGRRQHIEAEQPKGAHCR